MRALTRRRLLLLSLGAPVALAGCRRSRGLRRAERELAALEARVGGRLGLFALESATGLALAHRAEERFALCSTFKWALAAAVLSRVDRGALSLEERVSYDASALLEYAPSTRAHLSEGAMSVRELARAAVVTSDNTAANLLLPRVGGPAGLTRWMRSLGDRETRLDRDEPSLNENAPGDPRDTTTPRAMVTLLQRALLGDALSAPSRALLLEWMRATETGRARLRAGLPAGWLVADKTGTGQRGAVNDVAHAVPPGRSPLLLALYLSDSDAPLSALQGVHAAAARIVAATLGG